MDSDSWSRLSSSSRRSLRPRFDMLLGYEDMDFGEEEMKAEIPCPFCGEELDTLELCFHIDDEHPVEAKNGICPICVARVGTDLVGHITIQHANFYKMQKKRRTRSNNRSNPFGSSSTNSTIALLRKDIKDLFNNGLGSSHSFTSEPDPLISSFVSNVPLFLDEEDNGAPRSVQVFEDEQSEERDDIMDGISLEEENRVTESIIQPSVPKEDLEERTKRTQFVQGLVLSTLFDDFTL